MFENRSNIPVESVPDPVTGEMIHRVVLEQKYLDDINGCIKKHQDNMNGFIMNSQNFFMLLQAQLEGLKKIKEADDAIKKTLNDTVRKAKLDPKKPWSFNMILKAMEYRTPPVVKGMTEAEIKASVSPGTPVQTKMNPSAGVS